MQTQKTVKLQPTAFKDQLFTTTEVGKAFNFSRREIHDIITRENITAKKVSHGSAFKYLIDWEGYSKFSKLSNAEIINVKEKVKTFSNAKGGVGKSALASHFIMECNYRGLKVLAIDLDPQGQLSYNLGIDDLSDIKTFRDCLDANGNPVPDGIKNSVVELTPLLSILPADLNLNNVEIILALKKVGSENILKNAINQVKKNYDIIIIDTNPYISLTHANALFAADEILTPALTDLNSHRGLSYMFSVLEEFFPDETSAPKIRIIPNAYDVRDNISKESYQEMKEEFPEFLTDTKIRISTDIKNASKFQQSIRQHKKSSRAVVDFSELTSEILQ